MKLTCVTAVFNAIKSGNSENLIRCVRSVAALKTEHEHLIYDGASTDGTIELLRELEGCGKMPNLRVVSEPDTGIYNALNKGIRDAQGEWFYVLGCDDEIAKPNVLDELITSVDQRIDVIATPVPVLGEEHPHTMFAHITELRFIFDCCVCCHQGEIARTALLRHLGGFDERYRISADTNMFLLAHLSHARFEYVMRDFAIFRAGGSAQTNKNIFLKEDRDCVARALNLSLSQAEKFSTTRILPSVKMINFLWHDDLAIRMAAREMIWRRLKPIFRVVFYPLVVVTRPIRYGKWRKTN